MIKLLNKIITPQLVKFVFIGSINTVLCYTIFLLCIYFFHLHYVIALIVDYIFGILISYFWNRRWTFKSNGKISKEIRKFIFVYLVAFVLNYVSLLIFIDFFGIEAIFAQIIAIAIITPLTFLSHKMWSFVEKELKN